MGSILRLERKSLSTMGHSEAPVHTRKAETLTDCRGWPESMRCLQWWHLMTHKESSLEPLTGTSMPLLQIGWGELREGSNLPWPQQWPYFCAKKWKLDLPEAIDELPSITHSTHRHNHCWVSHARAHTLIYVCSWVCLINILQNLADFL